ncbi:methyltransferase domain-containing protein [Chloroflexota bacterium]
MIHPAWLLVSGMCFGVSGWQLFVWLRETHDKNNKYQTAKSYAHKRGKPLLIAGGPWGSRPVRRWLRIPAHGDGHVCLDIDRNAIGEHPNGVVATVTHIPFGNKSFGAVFVSHLLEHLASVDDAKKALAEFNRVAEAVYIAYPFRQSISGWITPGHHLWVWQKDNTIYLKPKGKSRNKEDYHYLNTSD